DPLHAALYMKGATPLSALEVHDALMGGRTEEVRIERLAVAHSAGRPGAASGPGHPADAEEPAALLSVFYNVAVSTRNDFARLAQPLTIEDRERIFLRFADPRSAPFRHLNFTSKTTRREEFLPPMNQVTIEAKPDARRQVLHLTFDTHGTCPQFSN